MLLSRSVWSSSLRTAVLLSVFAGFVLLLGSQYWLMAPVPEESLPKPEEPQPWLPPRPQDASQIQRAIVVPTVDPGEIHWMKMDDFEQFEIFTYCMGENPPWPECHIPRTRQGNEAGAYLSFILDYYDSLPKYTIFLHDKQSHWHNDILGPKTADTLPAIRFEAVDAFGYVNLRCHLDPGCPLAMSLFEPPESDIILNTTRARFVGIYQEMFGVSIDEVPEEIGNICCAQFAVTREQILKRPRSDYARLMNWLIDQDVDSSHSKGWAFEKIWHIIFGQASVHCPREDQCRCDLYGWCGPLVGGEVLRAVV